VRVADDEIEIALDEAIAAISPGQSLVMYADDGSVLGGGIIAAARTTRNPLPLLASFA